MSTNNTGCMLKDLPQDKVAVVTLDDWFFHTNGQQYKCIVGRPKVVQVENVLGFKPKASTDWMLKFDDGRGDEVLVAGCRVHYITTMNLNKPISAQGLLDLRF